MTLPHPYRLVHRTPDYAGIMQERDENMWFSEFVHPQKTMALWTKQMEEQLARAEAVGQQVEKMQSVSAERTRGAIDDSAKLARATVDWAFELSTAWRNASFEMTRKAMQSVTPPAAPKAESEA